MGTSADGALERLAEMYGGYCFDSSRVPVFNPVGLGNALSDMRLSPHWFETGTPGWLMSYVKRKPINLDDLRVGEQMLGNLDPANPSMAAVLLQTGYLTIKEFEQLGRLRSYRLGFPNYEVEHAFNAWLRDAYARENGEIPSGR